jgi:hypothetical protein
MLEGMSIAPVMALIGVLSGTALTWVALRLTFVLTRLVRPERSPAFSAVHTATIWAIGLIAAVVGFVVAVSSAVSLTGTI